MPNNMSSSELAWLHVHDLRLNVAWSRVAASCIEPLLNFDPLRAPEQNSKQKAL